MTKFLCHALAECNAVPNVPLDIEGLILVLIERSHIGRRQLLHSAHINGSRVEHNGNELSGVTVKGRCSRLLAAGLCHIEHLLDIVGNAGRAVILGVFNRFKNGQALSTLVDLHAVLLPITKILELSRLRLLLVNEQSVGGRVAIHSCLRIEICPELVGVADNLSSGIVDHLIDSILLRLFLGGVFLRRKSRRSCAAALLTLKIVGHTFLPLF